MHRKTVVTDVYHAFSGSIAFYGMVHWERACDNNIKLLWPVTKKIAHKVIHEVVMKTTAIL